MGIFGNAPEWNYLTGWGRQVGPSRLAVSAASSRPGGQTGIVATRVGLRLPEALAFETWRQTGMHLSRVADSSAWCLGDWLVYGETQYRDRYRVAIDAVGLSYQTLRNYAWVARRFAPSRRRDTLSLYHHMEVAKLPVAEQDRWLEQAIAHGWSTNQLRQQLRRARQHEESAAAPNSVVKINVPKEHLELWRDAAAREPAGGFEEWIIDALNRAAAAVVLDES
jgi:hypothetical protein